jgi:hypothetical protein
MKLTAALGVLLLISGLAATHAQSKPNPACTIMRIDGAAILLKCDGQLRSFALSMPGTERTPVAVFRLDRGHGDATLERWLQ